MTAGFPDWHMQVHDEQEVLSRTIRFDGIKKSFECACRIIEIIRGTEAEKDFTVYINPAGLTVILHAYSQGRIPNNYRKIAEQIGYIIDTSND